MFGYRVEPEEPSRFAPGDVCSALHFTRESLALFDALNDDGRYPVTILNHDIVLAVQDFAGFIADYCHGECSVRETKGRRESCVWVNIGNNCHIRVYCVESCPIPEYDAVCNWKPLKG